MGIVFFGSAQFSLAALEACLQAGREIFCVVTTPVQKQGRGLREIPNPVYQFCAARGLPCLAPESLKTGDARERVQALRPELFVVSSYGKLIPDPWLAIPSLSLNVHPSLLPLYRGAAPVNWPILNGDTHTGVSIAEVTGKLDGGDIFHQVRAEIPPDCDSAELSRLLAALSAGAIQKVLADYGAGKISRQPQDDRLSTYARKLEKTDGLIDWRAGAAAIARQIRGLFPWPVAYTYSGAAPLQVLKAHVESERGASAAPGEILEISGDGSLKVRAGSGVLALERVKPAGKKEMSGADFARGKRLGPGAFLEPAPAGGES